MKRTVQSPLFFPRNACALAVVLFCAASAPAAMVDELNAKGFALASKHYTVQTKEQTYTDADLVQKLVMSACQGEFEPVTLTLIAGKDLAGVTVSAGELKSAGGASIPASAFEIRHQVAQTTGQGQAEVNRSLLYPALKPQAIKQGQNMRFWITVRVPADAPPGLYSGMINVKGDGLAATVPLELKVHGFKHGRLPGRHTSMIGVSNDLVHYRDCAEHGMTVICGGGGGKYVESPDGSVRLPDLDDCLKLSKQVGLDEIFITGLGGLVPTSKVKNTSHILTFRHYLHTQRMRKIALAYREICKKENLPEVIWYIFDEPGRGDVQQLGPLRHREATRLYTEIDELPGVRTLLTIGREEAEEFGQHYNIHCWGGAPTPENCKLTRERGGLVWRYSNDISMGVNPFFSRWAMGFFPWACGWDGSTSWTYPCELMGEDGKPIPPDVWEGIREGIDDWYYLLTLEGLIARANASNKGEAKQVAAEADKALAAIKAKINPRSQRENPFKNGLEMDAARAEVAAWIEKVGAKL